MGDLDQIQFEPNEYFNINFTLTGTMSPDNLNAASNEVIAQLSDAEGNFNNPIELGRKNTDESGVILARMPNLPNGDHYRIRIISTNYPMIGDNIQEISILNTSNVEEKQVFCSLYPNPFLSTLTVTAEDVVQNIRVYDIHGRMLKEQPVFGTHFDLDMSELSSGSYLLQIDHGIKQSLHRMLKIE